jgi:dihydrofolate synthase/folylpolyglutamate synthase
MTPPRTLDDWLAHCERLNPKSMEFTRERVEFTLDRVRAVRERLDLRFDCPVISVAGTNGKGSTCAMIESIARHAGSRCWWSCLRSCGPGPTW